MAKYSIVVSKTAQKQLDKLPSDTAEMIIGAIKKLSLNPRPPGSIKLKGRSGYRIRKGKYRIIYDVHDAILTIDVIAIGHRKEIYN